MCISELPNEPLSNLDAMLRLTMRTEIKALQKRLDVTTILVTHDQLDATTMADVCLRPEHMRFGDSGIPGRVAQLEPMGREILYVIDSPVGHVRILEGGSVAAHRIGDEIHIAFEPDVTLVFEAGNNALLPNAHVLLPNGDAAAA